MQTKTKIYSFVPKSYIVLLLIVVFLAGIVALPEMVTQAQQATATPTVAIMLEPTALPNLRGTIGQLDVSYSSSHQSKCSGVMADSSDKIWQVWPSNGVVRLGNGSQPATIQVVQCSGSLTEAEAQAYRFWLNIPIQGWIQIPKDPGLIVEFSDGSEHTVNATYEFSPNSQPGRYTLRIENGRSDWLDYEFEVLTGPVIRLQSPITDKMEFRQGETVSVNYWWFSPNSRLEVGLYQIEDSNPLRKIWEITVDGNGNYHGEWLIPEDIQPGTYQLAACSLDGRVCNPALSDLFDVKPGADVSLPYNPTPALPGELPSD